MNWIKKIKKRLLELFVNADSDDLKNESIEWYKKELRKIARNKGIHKKKAFKHADSPFIGGLFQYFYDPRWKDKLPYWDTFPIVIPFILHENGFTGLNLHYLKPANRIKVLNMLLDSASEAKTLKKYTQVSQSKIRMLAKSEIMKPCIKRYLTSHIQTNIISIEYQYWRHVAMLPTHRFQHASTSQIWQ